MNSSPMVIWLETNTCAGNTISFLNTKNPPLIEVLQTDFNLILSFFIMAAEGEMATRIWELPEVREGSFILIIEGTVPTAFNGRTATIGQVKGKDVTALELVSLLGAKAEHVLAVGTCATFGGPFAAWPNPTGSLPVFKILERQVINIPGCPINPRWLLETLYRLKKEKVKLDALGRPRFLYGKTIHNHCERLPFYKRSFFARKHDEDGCMYLLGCKGPVTFSDCSQKRWIEERSGWPVGVNTPCIGCTSPEFPDGMGPFFHHHADLYNHSRRINSKSLAKNAGTAALVGICAHITGKIITGRIKFPRGAKLINKTTKK